MGWAISAQSSHEPDEIVRRDLADLIEMHHARCCYTFTDGGSLLRIVSSFAYCVKINTQCPDVFKTLMHIKVNKHAAQIEDYGFHRLFQFLATREGITDDLTHLDVFVVDWLVCNEVHLLNIRIALLV